MSAWPQRLRPAATLFLFSAFVAFAGAQSTDAFLDGKIANPPVPIPCSFAEELKNVEVAVGVPLSLPEGFAAFLARKKPQVPCWMSEGRPDFVTRRDYLKEITWNLQMSTDYDAKRKVVVMDFIWRNASPRPARDILGQLERQPLPKAELMLDPAGRDWSQLLDQLIGCTENYAAGWRVRIMQNCATPNAGLYIGGEVHRFHIRDSSGADHLAILMWFPPSTIPGPRPKVVACLFNHDGILEDGGTFEAGSILAPPSFKAGPDGRSASLHLDIDRERDFGFQAAFDGSQPSFDRWGEFNFGAPSLDYDASTKAVILRLKSKFRDSFDLQMQVDHGKFQTALFKNGVVMHPPEYHDSGLSAFDDALY